MAERRPATVTLYLSGHSRYSTEAVRALRSVCRERLADTYRLEIVNVLSDPELARDAGVIVTPTLIARAAGREARRIGRSVLNQESVASLLRSLLPDAPSATATHADQQYRLDLYVNRSGSQSAAAVRAVRAFAEEHLEERYVLETTDVLSSPVEAHQAGVVVTPTLIASIGEREVRCVGRRVADSAELARALRPILPGAVEGFYPRRVVLVGRHGSLIDQLEPWLRGGRIPYTAFDDCRAAAEALRGVSSKTLRAVLIVNLASASIDELRELAAIATLRPGAFHVVALTPEPDPMQEATTLQLGCSAYLPATVEPADLYLRLRELLGVGAAHRPSNEKHAI